MIDTPNVQSQDCPSRPNPRYVLLTVLGVLAIWGTLCFLFYDGFGESDNLHYMRFAYFWDRVPVDPWEARLPMNAVLHIAYAVFGPNAASAALPGLLGTLLILGSGMWLSWHERHSLAIVLLVGVILAFLPINITIGSPSPRVLAAGLVAFGTAFLLGGRHYLSAIVAGISFAVATWTHVLSAGFSFSLVVVSGVLGYRRRLHCVVTMLTAVVVFLALDMGIYAMWAGDPLLSFRIARKVHLSSLDSADYARHILTESGEVSLWFFWRPVQDLLVSREFGLLGGVAVLGTLTAWSRRTRMCKVLALTVLMAWAGMSYCTHDPTRYVPIPLTTGYWQSMGLMLALITAELLADLPKRVLLGITLAGLIGVDIVMLSVSGPWGQGMPIARELLNYAEKHPHEFFVTDDRTLKDQFVLSGFKAPTNICAVPKSPGPGFYMPKRVAEIPRKTPIFVLYNPLHDRPEDRESREWLLPRCGKVIFKTETTYRRIAYLLPRSYCESHSWTIRKPSAQVCELVDNDIEVGGIPP